MSLHDTLGLSASAGVYRALLQRLLRSVFQILVICVFYVVVCVPLWRRAYMASPSGVVTPAQLGNGSDGVLIAGIVQDVDRSNLQVPITWTVLGCGQSYCLDCETYGLSCGTLLQSVAIFVDSAASDILAQLGSSRINTSSATAVLEGQSSSAEWTGGSLIGRTQAVPSFQTIHAIDVARLISNRVSTGSAFPHDNYAIFPQFVAVSISTGSTIPITGIEPYMISNGDWVVEVLPENGQTGSLRYIGIYFKRPFGFVTFVTVVFVVNWCIALAVLLITVWVMFLRVPEMRTSRMIVSTREHPDASAVSLRTASAVAEPEGQSWKSVGLESLSILPLTALFSMPQLRQAIDFPINTATDGSGFLACMLVVAACTALMLGLLAINLLQNSLEAVRQYIHSHSRETHHTHPIERGPEDPAVRAQDPTFLAVPTEYSPYAGYSSPALHNEK